MEDLIFLCRVVFTIFDSLSAHFQKSENPQTCHIWFLINCDRFINLKMPKFRTQFPKPGQIFPESTVHDCLLVSQIS